MGNPRSSRGGIAYTIILPGAILAALALSAIAIESLNAMRRLEWNSDVVTIAVNVVPALLAGVLVYGLTALWLRRNGWLEGGFLSHLRRSTPLYLAAVFCGAIVVRAWNSPDFWFWLGIVRTGT